MKIPVKVFKKKRKKSLNLEDIKKNLRKNNACYVLITCSQPSKDGEMQVELNYSGDDNLASYLIDGAQDVFETRMETAKDNF
ncbi:MAG: hypothetical protein K1060chlam1_00046 [Candidatus Anoxychlamydiales bacterium]|nr:hypothetical protein [Candidatus Anoxychlamydiales bacterium]